VYVPRHFSETDPVYVRNFIRRHNFATLVSFDGVRPVATHLLLDVRETEAATMTLSGHMARANTQWLTDQIRSRHKSMPAPRRTALNVTKDSSERAAPGSRR
jgi:predicted FMN-binding regulatory protein PaiB